eukprot:c32710_g1_i1 orf=23-229(+)
MASWKQHGCIFECSFRSFTKKQHEGNEKQMTLKMEFLIGLWKQMTLETVYALSNYLKTFVFMSYFSPA